MRLVVAVMLAWAVLARPAAARNVTFYDLAGLVLRSDAVVVAERTAIVGRVHQYRVVKVLRGAGQIPAWLELDQSGIQENGLELDDTTVLFLRLDGTPRLAAEYGFRMFAAGRVVPFAQPDSPGPLVARPDVHPDDAPALDLAGLEAEIAKAAARVDEVLAAASDPDGQRRRRRVLAAVRPHGEPDHGSLRVNLLGQHAADLLYGLGDTEGALLVTARARDWGEVELAPSHLRAVLRDRKAAREARVLARCVLRRRNRFSCARA